VTTTLGYLLKHAQSRFSEIASAEFAPLGISGREAAVLRAIDAQPPEAQGDIARRMGVDRTTMVTLVDELEAKGLVRRRQDPDDRRRNVVELTDTGKSAVSRAAEATVRAEREFLRPLPAAEAERFRRSLGVLLGDNADLVGTRPACREPGTYIGTIPVREINTLWNMSLTIEQVSGRLKGNRNHSKRGQGWDRRLFGSAT
jgi:DNA-binding MarR family transcriptional regulator